MALDTRDHLLDVAETLFADRGFYGVSIAAIAGELGLTKQALLHHFGTKEKLYGEVLRRISEHYGALASEATQRASDHTARLKFFLQKLQTECSACPDQTRLLLRELLDNKRRADSASVWYLEPFLRELISMVRALPGRQGNSDAEALCVVYQLLGAMIYFTISEPTLSGIFGKEFFDEMSMTFPLQFERVLEKAL